MKEKGILFSAPMIRALLDGIKTQTRRVVQPQPEHTGKVNAFTPFEQDAWRWHGGPSLVRATYGSTTVHTDFDHMVKAMLKVCPYGAPGTHLWVKETWRAHLCAGRESELIHHRADGESCPYDGETIRPWKPSIFMPRWASRITLEITAVRIERLQDISPQDARAEGVTPHCKGDHLTHDLACHIEAFERLWDSIQLQRAVPKGAFAWSANPFVWVLEFKRVQP